MMRTHKGVAASPAIAVGPVFLYRPLEPRFERQKIEDAEREIARFKEAVESSKEQLAKIHAQTEKEAGSELADIFEAHLLFLEDPALHDGVEEKMRGEKINAEAALAEVIDGYAATLAALENEYMRQRAVDVRDVGRRVLRNLLGVSAESLSTFTSPVIVVAHDLTPSDTAQMKKEMVLGFCTAMGSITSHTAILARMLGIPAVVGLGERVLSIEGGEMIIVDGTEGVVTLHPDEETVQSYKRQQRRFEKGRKEAMRRAKLPAQTKDGHRVEVVANIGDVESARVALEYGAEGVGLLRTEFLFFDRQSMPSEGEQYSAYRAVAEVMGQRPLIIRTLDIGGDKQLTYLEIGEELNPFLGWRAIRLCLGLVALFKTQLRAILRAAHGHNVKVMFPMIATLEELERAKEILHQAQDELLQEGLPLAQDIEVGIMVETPSAALAIDILAPEADFFSIGTNDLIQYTMACDRTNERVSYLYEPLHPAILRLIKHAIDAAHQAGRWAGMCGEMAGDLEAIPILLGLGLDEFSMNAPAIPRAKALIRSLSMDEAQEIATRALSMIRAEEIRNYVRNHIKGRY
jgi:phosphotransferase system enzyme I (PtsI)